MDLVLERARNKYRRDGLGPLVRTATSVLKEGTLRLGPIDRLCFALSVRKLSNHMEAETNRSDVLDTIYDYSGYGRYRTLRPAQIRAEFCTLLDLVAGEQPEAAMEIGTMNGGTFYAWCRALEECDTVISLDLPGGEFGGGYSAEKTRFFRRFAPAKELQFVRANSHDDRTRDRIEVLLDERELDFLFIDGDHTYEGVKQDFKMYRQFMADGGIVAFHDIVPHPHDPDCEVDQFWDEIAGKYETREIIDDPDQEWAGIGVLYL